MALRRCSISILLLILMTFPGTIWAQVKEKLAEMEEEEVTFFEERDLTANFFRSETEIGGIFTTGNVEQISVSGSSDTVWRIKRFKNEWRVGGYYNREFFNSDDPDDPPETIARYIYGTYRMDYFLTQMTTFFTGVGGFTDQIKGIPLGATGFLGIGHYFIWTEKTALNLSGGYQFVGEKRDDPDPPRYLNTAKVELSFRQRINPNVTFIFNVDSKKDVASLDEWLIDSDIQFRVKLYKMLSLVVGFTTRFDNVPVTGFRKLDTVSSLSLGFDFQSPKPKKGKDGEIKGTDGAL